MLKTDFKEILSSQLFKTVSETADELGLETYVTLSNLFADQSTPEDPGTPMGIPA